MDQQVILAQLYNLILNPATRDFERANLLAAKQALEASQRLGGVLDKLIGDLRPLGARGNLTPDVMDFYLMTTGAAPVATATKVTAEHAEHLQTAIFAGGCFWCLVEPFDTQPGIISVTSGYTGGTTVNPTYDQVLVGNTGHVEAVAIVYDPAVKSYQDLVATFWQLTDPTDADGQFLDRDPQYQSVIFYTNDTQHAIAEDSKQALIDSNQYDKPIVTKVLAATTFYPAENFHQDFYKKFPKRVKAMDRARHQLQQMQRIRVAGKRLLKLRK
ncbi:peptide-methionine (S)-S-oxide reductase MsrA [Weissella soli]|uniref:peptide-methionine (S)-S-oxide reductase MsrA n=1 Tax=Weissella soli TaxID=155866 RepID=UPI0035A03D02